MRTELTNIAPGHWHLQSRSKAPLTLQKSRESQQIQRSTYLRMMQLLGERSWFIRTSPPQKPLQMGQELAMWKTEARKINTVQVK